MDRRQHQDPGKGAQAPSLRQGVLRRRAASVEKGETNRQNGSAESLATAFRRSSSATVCPLEARVFSLTMLTGLLASVSRVLEAI
jgi:hypothetical protein